MIELIDWKTAIDKCEYDEKVGVRIAKLFSDNIFGTFITIIDPGKYVNQHYHKNGEEYYHIISGRGKIKLKYLANNIEETADVCFNQSFLVPENTLHQLINIDKNIPLLLMFSCPLDHLQTDRYFL